MNRQRAFSFSVKDCSGCMACVVACQDQNEEKTGGVALRSVKSFETGSYPAVRTSISLSCMHCTDAPCLLACPSEAISRHPESGVVDVDRDTCIGCRSCESACPFGAPRFTEDEKMIKCDFCLARVENELEPACVHTCTTGALKYGLFEVDDKQKTIDEAAALLKAFLSDKVKR